MILTELTLQAFRSYAKRTFTFSPRTTLIVGPNAAGKTNMLEAVMMVATGKSFRAEHDRECIRWDSQMADIRCRTSDEDVQSLEIRMSDDVKKYLVNGVARRQIDFVGKLRAVLFWPEHLELITDSPSIRRKYLDGVLIQVDREYRRNLNSYERGLRQRNKLLELVNEGKAHRHQLLFWNQLLVSAGGYVTDVRAAFIDFINQTGTYRIEYDKSVISDTRLAQYKEEEIAAKATLVGPHRDDFRVMTDDLDLSKYGSRGEQRLAILWLKRAEVSYIERKTGERPILLLDDIFSELDREHRTNVIPSFGNQQTIVTCADRDIIRMLPKDITIITV